jgi:Cu-Zn family superoxide dismutase
MKLPVTFALSIAFVSGCAMLSPAPSIATAELAPTPGNKVSGPTTFVRQGDKILVDARLKGLKPGRHGFHIHENGNCGGPDASGAGGHFNPIGTAHGDPAAASHHRGDLGNIVADANGNAVLTTTLSMDGLSFASAGPNSIIGRALVVHADPDDMTTQPSGNSGMRLACGIIVLQ